jgi:hypothetical protein
MGSELGVGLLLQVGSAPHVGKAAWQAEDSGSYHHEQDTCDAVLGPSRCTAWRLKPTVGPG